MDRNKKENFLYNRNIQEAIIFSIISIVMLVYSLSNHYRIENLQWKVSPYLFPLLIAVFIGVLSISLFIEGLHERKISNKIHGENSINKKALLFTILISVLYFILMQTIGFIPSTILFLVSLLLYLGEKRIWLVALVSIISALSLYILFGVLLHVMLP